MGNIVNLKSSGSPRQRFEKLIAPHFDALYSAARRMSMSLHDAEDLVQEVCIKAFNRLEELEKIEYVRAWLLRVMYNHFVDETRRASKSPVQAAWTGEQSEDPDELASRSAQPDEVTELNQQVENVIRAMRYLNAEECALVAMHDVEGLSIRELCQLTDMPEGTVKARLHRTRRKLGRLLQNDAVKRPRLEVIGERS